MNCQELHWRWLPHIILLFSFLCSGFLVEPAGAQVSPPCTQRPRPTGIEHKHSGPLPLVEFDAPRPTDPAERAKRDKRDAAMDMHDPTPSSNPPKMRKRT